MPRQVVGQFANEVPSSIAPSRKAFQHLGWLNSAAMDGHMGMPWGWMGRSWITQKKNAQNRGWWCFFLIFFYLILDDSR